MLQRNKYFSPLVVETVDQEHIPELVVRSLYSEATPARTFDGNVQDDISLQGMICRILRRLVDIAQECLEVGADALILCAVIRKTDGTLTSGRKLFLCLSDPKKCVDKRYQ